MIIIGFKTAGKAYVVLQPTVGDMPQKCGVLTPHPLRIVPVINGIPAFDWGQTNPGGNHTLAAALLRVAMDDGNALVHAHEFVEDFILEFHELGFSIWPEQIGQFARARV